MRNSSRKTRNIKNCSRNPHHISLRDGQETKSHPFSMRTTPVHITSTGWQTARRLPGAGCRIAACGQPAEIIMRELGVFKSCHRSHEESSRTRFVETPSQTMREHHAGPCEHPIHERRKQQKKKCISGLPQIIYRSVVVYRKRNKRGRR